MVIEAERSKPYQGRRANPTQLRTIQPRVARDIFEFPPHGRCEDRPVNQVRITFGETDEASPKAVQADYFGRFFTSLSHLDRRRLRSSDDPYFAKSKLISLMSVSFGACGGIG